MAKYVIMIGTSPYRSTLGIYREGYRQWNPVRDGFAIGEESLIGTLEQARTECDRATTLALQQGVMSPRLPYIVELPIRINPARSALHPAGYYDPELSRVE